MIMIDLYSGLKGASAAMSARGWDVITVDNNPENHPDILADIRTWVYQGDRPLLVWASPPCTEFSKAGMPWYEFNPDVDRTLYEASRRIILESAPVYWIIENTRGAVYYLGPPSQVIFPYYLWGRFPPLSPFPMSVRPKSTRTSGAFALRALIPYELSLAVCLACERQLPMMGINDG